MGTSWRRHARLMCGGLVIACGALQCVNSSTRSSSPDYAIGVTIYGACASLESFTFLIQGKAGTTPVPAVRESEELGADICVVPMVQLCTEDRATFEHAPLRIVVSDGDIVLNDALVNHPLCTVTKDGAPNNADIALYVEPDGTTRSDFGIHPLVTFECSVDSAIGCVNGVDF